MLEREVDVHQAIQVAKNPAYSKPGADGTIIKGAILADGRILEIICNEVGGGKIKRIIIRTAYYPKES